MGTMSCLPLRLEKTTPALRPFHCGRGQEGSQWLALEAEPSLSQGPRDSSHKCETPASAHSKALHCAEPEAQPQAWTRVPGTPLSSTASRRPPQRPLPTGSPWGFPQAFPSARNTRPPLWAQPSPADTSPSAQPSPPPRSPTPRSMPLTVSA